MGKIIKIREVGELVLNKMSEEVDIININNDILDIIEDIKTTLIDGIGLGISAPKIGINKRIIVVGAKRVTDKDGFATKENRKKYNL